jgi:hypothetical protein
MSIPKAVLTFHFTPISEIINNKVILTYVWADKGPEICSSLKEILITNLIP